MEHHEAPIISVPDLPGTHAAAPTRQHPRGSAAAYRAFADAYRRAADALRTHRDDCAFPEGCIPPLHRACAPPAAA